MRIDPIKKMMGENIKSRRMALDISQEHLGELVNLSRASIANIERGTHAIDTSQLFLFARKLNTTPAKLLPEFDEDPLNNLSDAERYLVENLIKEARAHG